MGLKELIKEVESLKSVDGSISSFTYQRLVAIKQTIEGIDECMSGWFIMNTSVCGIETKDWEKLKTLLELKQ